MTELLAQLKAARRDLVIRLAENLDPEERMPSPGYIQMLADLHGAVAAVEVVLAEDVKPDTGARQDERQHGSRHP